MNSIKHLVIWSEWRNQIFLEWSISCFYNAQFVDIDFCWINVGLKKKHGSCVLSGLPEPPGAALFGWSRSRFFGPAPAPTLLWLWLWLWLCDYDYMTMRLWLRLRLGVGAGAGIGLELEPEISKMAGSGNPAVYDRYSPAFQKCAPWIWG